MSALAEVQLETKVHVAGVGCDTNFTGDQVALVADYSARVVRIGEELEVPFERVLFMRRATPAKPVPRRHHETMCAS